jgi:hypothetical protein
MAEREPIFVSEITLPPHTVKQNSAILPVSRSGYYEPQHRSAKPVSYKASGHL